MKIEILGTGCQRCSQLYENSLSAVAELVDKEKIEVAKVSDIQYFAQKGVFLTPGLVVDGEVISTGKVPTVAEIKKIIEEKL